MPTRQLDPDVLTFEAPTVEEALARVSAEVGQDAEILGARKVARGGIAGFFAREMVELTVRPKAGAPQTESDAETGKGDALTVVLEKMSRSVDDQEDRFQDVLRRQLVATGVVDDRSIPAPAEPAAASQPPAAPPSVTPAAASAPQPSPATPAIPNPAIPDPAQDSAPPEDLPAPTPVPRRSASPVAPPAMPSGLPAAMPAARSDAWRIAEIEAPAGAGAPAWSTTALARLGVPAAVIDAVAGLDPRDDLGWIHGIAAAVANWCVDIVPTDHVVAGPEAERLAPLLDLPVVTAEDAAPYGGGFVASVGEDPRAPSWLEWVLGDRALHLVVAGRAWRDLLIGDPAVVSWTRDEGVIDALYLASTLGASLGFGLDGAGRVVRMTPVEVALAVRRLVERA